MAIKFALVTGASKGIGKDVAKVLAKEGVKVMCLARSKELLDKIKGEIEADGGECEVMVCDMEDRSMIVSVTEKIKSAHGTPDLIINNAGCYYFQNFADQDYDSWDRMINLNIRAYLVITGEFINEMKTRGSGTIVNITSDNEREGSAGMVVYSGTKHFWTGASEALRLTITTDMF